jgi:Rap1a immunity proteins
VTRWLGALVLVSCSAPPPADTNALALKTGNDLLAVCSDSATGMKMACVGYIASAVDSYSATFCPLPATSTRGQARDLVVQYLRDHPEERNGRAIGEVWQALSTAWPCQKQEPLPQKRR